MDGKWKRILKIMVLFLFTVVFEVISAGCKYNDAPPLQKTDTESAYTVTDSLGNRVTLPKKPKRIITGSLVYDTIVTGIVTPDHLVAINDSDLDPGISYITKEVRDIRLTYHSMNTIPLEMLLKTKPDVIIASQWTPAENLTSYRQLGFPVVICKGPNSFHELRNAIRLVAQALQEEKRGEAVIAEMDRQLAEIDAVLSRRTDRRPVALLVSQMTNYGGPGSMYHEIITRARIENGIEKVGLKNGDYLAKELVVKARPDFFFVSSHRANSTESSEKFRDEFLSDQALQGLPALQHIHSVPDRYLYSATQNIPYAVKALANIAYGPVFDMGDEHCIKGY